MASPFERPGPREQQRLRTRAQLFEAALAEFAKVGFERASIAEIARAVGVSRPSFYFHFPTKDHVLLELQWHKENEIVEQLRPAADLRALLEALPDAVCDAYDSIEGPGVARDVAFVYARRPAKLPLAEQPFPLVRLLEERFAAGAARGELRAGIEPERAPLMCLTSVFGYLIANRPEAERRADLRTIAGLFLPEGVD
ncbi:MAG: helix-turn-helix domain-containing protein [Myxococcota bacterium]